MLPDFDKLVNDERFQPYWGWHDDHRHLEGTGEYKPVIHQNRSEFIEFAQCLDAMRLKRRCLQLGLGFVGGAHHIFNQIFDEVLTVDNSQYFINQFLSRFPEYKENIITGNTHDPVTKRTVHRLGLFDCLFIDADHIFNAVESDFNDYASVVRFGGMIAFHDVLHRAEYEDVIQVDRFIELLRTRGYKVNIIGAELGVGYILV